MKRILQTVIVILICGLFSGCVRTNTDVQVAATTAPIYEFTVRICNGTDISVGQIITENVSCLHDYTLQTSQMRMIENAELVVISGAGLEDFMQDTLGSSQTVIDASASIPLLCSESDHAHQHEEHAHAHDPHIWLSPDNAAQIARNICDGLKNAYPQHADQFDANLLTLLTELSTLSAYGKEQLQSLSSRQLITFHDGFAYFADAFDLEVLYAIEEESGSEAPASELIEICQTIEAYKIPAVFTEQNGSTSASAIISAETGVSVYQLDMAISGNGYFPAMYNNIYAIKEALE